VCLNTAWLFELFEYFFDSWVQKLLYLFVFIAWHIVEVGIFKHSSEQKAPGYPLNATLDIVYLSSSNLGIDMIWYLLQKTWLDGERVIQKFTVEVLLWGFTVHNSYSSVVELRSACSSYHLQKISGLEVYIFVRFCIKVLSTFDNDQTGREVDTPC
jgi:hypothetical protein